jgi:hypothetical protein
MRLEKLGAVETGAYLYSKAVMPGLPENPEGTIEVGGRRGWKMSGF